MSFAPTIDQLSLIIAIFLIIASVKCGDIAENQLVALKEQVNLLKDIRKKIVGEK